MAERLGAAYTPKAKRAAGHHGEHTQTTQATSWAESQINPTTGQRYQGHITGDLRDTPEGQAAYALLAKTLGSKRSG